MILRNFTAVLLLTLTAPVIQAAEINTPLSPELTLETQGADSITVRWDAQELNENETLQTLVAIPTGKTPSSELVDVHLDDRSQVQKGRDASAPSTLKDASAAVKYPALNVTLRPLGYVGRCRIASLLIRPTVRKRLERHNYIAVATSGRVVLSWSNNGQAEPQTAPNGIGMARDPRPFFDELLDSVVLNYPPPFQVTPPVKEERFQESPPWLRTACLRYRVKQEGPLTLSRKLLRSVVSNEEEVRPGDVVFLSGNRQLPVLYVDENGYRRETGPLAGSDRLVVWIPPSDDPYTAHNTVTLYIDRGMGRVMADSEGRTVPDRISSATVEIELEENSAFAEGGEENERQNKFWMWHAIPRGSTASVTIQRPSGALSDIHLDLFLYTERPFVLDATKIQAQLLALNGKPVEVSSVVQNGPRRYVRVQSSIDSDRLKPGENELTLTYPDIDSEHRVEASKDLLYLDRVALRAGGHFNVDDLATPLSTEAGRLPLPGLSERSRLAMDVTDPWNPHPLRIEGDALLIADRIPQNVSRVAPSAHRVAVFDPHAVKTPRRRKVSHNQRHDGILDPGRNVQALIVAPSSLIPALEPWIKTLEGRDISVLCVSLQDVCEVFGDGERRPHSIKSLVSHAVSRWPGGGPSWLVLVGDATWDVNGRLKNDVKNVMPSYRGKHPYAVESWFGAVLGDDEIPDVIVARLPVRNRTELRTLVSKLVRYEEERHTPQRWHNRALLLSDDGFEDHIAPVSQYALPQTMRHNQLFVADEPFVDNFYLPEPVRIRLKSKTSLTLTDKVIDTINEGVWLWEFFGHGAPNVIAHERAFFGGGSRFSDVKRLMPDAPLTMLWAFTCETGSFDYAHEKWNISIGEDLLVRHSGGAISLIAATGRGFPRDHELLCLGLHEAMFTRGLGTAGQALLAANLMGMAQRNDFEPLRQFALLGDPMVGPISFRELNGKVEWRDERRVAYDWNIPENLLEAGTEATVWWRNHRGQERVTQEQRPSQGRVAGVLDIESDGRSEAPGWLGIELRKDGSSVTARGASEIPGRDPLPSPPLVLDGTPNLSVVSARLVEPESPYTGQTVYFEALIANTGTASATQVETAVYDGPRDEGIRCTAKVGPKPVLKRLDPGESETVRIRWDPVENAGDHEMFVTVDPGKRTAELNEDDNHKSVELHVRQKANLVVQREDVQLTRLESGWRVDFVVRNSGDLPAERIQAELKIKRPGAIKPETLTLPREQGVTRTVEAHDGWANVNIKIPNVEWVEVTADPEGVVDEETHVDNTVRVPVPAGG